MTARELIAFLEKVDPDLPVKLWDEMQGLVLVRVKVEKVDPPYIEEECVVIV